MITDEVYNHIADQVYEVDENKNQNPWREDDKLKFDGCNYQVLAVEDNTTNGMQVMAIDLIVK